MTTTGEVLLDLLTARGVETVFGVPGNHTVALYRGFDARGIRHITCRHEQGAAFMADGYARATGRPGVCVLISGPGLLNAATAIAQARADSVPMLVISGVASVADLGMGRGTLHELPDQRATASSICRESYTLLDPANLPDLMLRAFAAFTTSRPGPIHIEIPLDLMDAPLEHTPLDPLPLLSAAGPDRSLIAKAAARLSAASEPLLLLGGGAVAAAEDIVALAERLDCPVLNTTNGKGICPASHPLAAGGSPSLPCLRMALAEADVVLAIGTELGETDYDLLMTGSLPAHPGLIRMDIDPSQLLIPSAPAIGITSSALAGVRALFAMLQPASPRAQTGAERTAELKREIQQEAHYHPEMQAFFQALQDAAPNAVIIGDSTRPTYYATWQLECQQPRRYFHSVSGFGTLGYALPAALGASIGIGAALGMGASSGIATEGTIALIGDGGIQFTLPELTTAAEQKLPIAIIIWHNDGYREIENSMRAKNVPADSTLILAPDFEAAAAAHHADYARPASLAALTESVRLALAADRPTLIEVREADFLSQPSGEWYS